MGFIEKIASLLPGNNNNVEDRNLGRNEVCWCGSGKKYKKCHLHTDQAEREKSRSLNCGST